MQRSGNFDNEAAEFRTKNDLGAAAFFPVVKAAVGDLCTEHLLETHRLGTELDLIGAVTLRFATLVFHRHRALRAFQI